MNGPKYYSGDSFFVASAVFLLFAVSACGGASSAEPEEEFAWLLKNALTPSMPGEWSLVGCEDTTILASSYFNLYINGYVCTWSGHDGNGKPGERKEWYDEAGKRRDTSHSST